MIYFFSFSLPQEEREREREGKRERGGKASRGGGGDVRGWAGLDC